MPAERQPATPSSVAGLGGRWASSRALLRGGATAAAAAAATASAAAASAAPAGLLSRTTWLLIGPRWVGDTTAVVSTTEWYSFYY